MSSFFGFRKLKIGNKLAIIMIGMSLVVIALVGSLFYFQFDKALTERVLMQLSSVARLKKIQIESLIDREIENVREVISQDQQLSTSVDPYYFISDDSPFQYDEIPDFVISLEAPPNSDDVWVHDLTTHFGGTIILAFTAQSPSGVKVTFVSYFPEIQDILLERTGLGLTGESYLVGTDSRMRSESRFYTETRPIDIMVETEGVALALKDGGGEKLIKDYRDVEVFSAFQKIEKDNLTWVLLSEIDYDEAFLPLESLKTNLSIILVVILVLVFFAAYQISRQLVRPILSVEDALIAMSQGNVDKKSVGYSGKDEIEQMIGALDKLKTTLNSTIEFAHQIGSGNFDAQYKTQSKDDMLGNALLKMQNELRLYQENEEKLIRENRKSLIERQESERSRLSREMHDGLGPMLTNLRFRIQGLDVEDETKKEMLGIIDNTIHEVRRMSYNLMPSVLQDFGAGEAIENMVAQLRESSGQAIRYKNSGIEKTSLPHPIHLALYRIAQEAVNNALKHAKAKEIRLSVTQFEDHVSLFVSDNGRGFDPASTVGGNGLRNIQERIKLVDGHLEISSTPGNGTTIEVEIPIE